MTERLALLGGTLHVGSAAGVRADILLWKGAFSHGAVWRARSAPAAADIASVPYGVWCQIPMSKWHRIICTGHQEASTVRIS
jgi:hypothetical protein